MTIISAYLIKDAINANKDRITTLELTYPRFIHSEFMTHRVFSRNASSSRAIPIKKQLRGIREQPAEPIHWGAHQKGMQASNELTGWRKHLAHIIWASHRHYSIGCASLLGRLGAHKQFANRITEVHNHIKVLVTSTKWANFLALRDHMAAQPEFRHLAAKVRLALDSSVPTLMIEGQHYLPYISAVDIDDIERYVTDMYGNADFGEKEFRGKVRQYAIQASVARCARVSYTLIDDAAYTRPDISREIEIGAQLINADPMHASPLEHLAQPDPGGTNKMYWGNFHGWVQYRKTLKNEAKYDKPYMGQFMASDDGILSL